MAEYQYSGMASHWWSQLGIIRQQFRGLRYPLPFALILAFLLFKIPPPVGFLTNPDQGYQLSLAIQVLGGKHPFVDFDPGVYGPLARIFHEIGGEILYNPC